MEKKEKYRGIIGLIDDQRKELRDLCASRDEEWVRNEMQKRREASKKRHDKRRKEMGEMK